MKYRARENCFNAIQYDNLNKEEVEEFLGEKTGAEIYDSAYKAGVHAPIRLLFIPTIEGEKRVKPSDFICKFKNGKTSVIDEDEFNRKFERIEDDLDE